VGFRHSAAIVARSCSVFVDPAVAGGGVGAAGGFRGGFAALGTIFVWFLAAPPKTKQIASKESFSTNKGFLPAGARPVA
jgi:hypothetical protein